MIKHYNKLWTEKYRPGTLEDMCLDEDIKSHFKDLNEDTPHLLLYGSPGVGKSTLAKIIVKQILKCQYLYINASDENGIDTIRNKVITFAQTRSIDDNKKVVILEEADGLTGESLRILRNVMEEYADTTRFILTANYYNKIIEPVRSRCVEFKLIPNHKACVIRCVEILKNESIKVPDEQKGKLLNLIEKNFPDMRRILNDLQKYSITQTLNISESSSFTSTSKNILQKLTSKVSPLEIRKFVIESEKIINNDYQSLLKSLFEDIYSTSEFSEAKKKQLLYELCEFTYRDNFVLDHEINFFMCLLALENALK